MEITKAKKIIESYEAAIAKGPEGGTVLRKISLLPHSKPMIKYAYYTMIEKLTEEYRHTVDEARRKMTSDYALLNYFVDDQTAKKYAGIYQEWQAKKSALSHGKKDENAVKQYLYFISALRNESLAEELDGFIDELERERQL